MLDDIIKSVFEKERVDLTHKCSNPETLAAYIDGLITGEKKEEIERHLVDCDLCLEAIILKVKMEMEHEVFSPSKEIVDVVVHFFKNVVKVISKINEVRVLPAPEPVYLRREGKVLRNIARFSKKLEEFSAEAEIEKLDKNIVNIRIKITKDELSLDDVRVTLLKNDKELASYITEEGCVIFEDVNCDNYEIRFTQNALFKGKLLLKVKDG